MNNMNWVDYLLAIIIGASVLSGFMAGFARVGIGTAATFVGIFAGFWCYGIVGAHFVDYVGSQAIANLIGFFLVFLAIVTLGAIIGRLLAAVFKWIGLSWFDRLLGAGFGAVRGGLVVVALTTVLLAFAPTPPPPSLVDSRFLPYVVDASNVLSLATPHQVKDAFRDTRDKVKHIWEEQVSHKPMKQV
jgi:membrane protein required for colicin V production